MSDDQTRITEGWHRQTFLWLLVSQWFSPHPVQCESSQVCFSVFQPRCWFTAWTSGELNSCIFGCGRQFVSQGKEMHFTCLQLCHYIVTMPMRLYPSIQQCVVMQLISSCRDDRIINNWAILLPLFASDVHDVNHPFTVGVTVKATKKNNILYVFSWTSFFTLEGAVFILLVTWICWLKLTSTK